MATPKGTTPNGLKDAQTAAATGTETMTDSDDIRRQMSVLQKDISELTRTIGEYGRVQGEQLKNTARSRAYQVRGEAEAHLRKGEAQARQAYADAEDAVRENPATAVGIAAGIGFLVGLVMARR